MMDTPTHGFDPVRAPIDDQDRGTHHDPVLWMAPASDDERCDVCGFSAGRPHADVCALGRLEDGTPRYPDWVVFRVCRGVIVCWREACSKAHFTPRPAELDEGERVAA